MFRRVFCGGCGSYVIGLCVDLMVGMVVVVVVGYCGVVKVVLVVTVFVRVAFYCCRSAIFRCMLCLCGCDDGKVLAWMVG